MTGAAAGEALHVAPRRVPYDARDMMVIGGAAAIAAVIALAARFAVPRLQPLTGLIVIMTIAYALSTNRRAIDRRTVAWGLSLQIVFALIVLKTTTGQRVFQTLGALINRLLGFASVGSSMVFGPLGDKTVWPRIMTTVLGPEGAQYCVLFAFQVLPTIIFIAALFAILYYFGVMQIVVRAFAVLMRRVMRASGAESLNVAASIFMGQTEAPLTIRPYLPRMTESELMTVMTSGMAHISGGIMAAYILFGIEAQHLLTAVIMTAPGTLMMSKIFVPETEVPETTGTVKLEIERTDVNVIDAAGRGTSEGLQLALNVGAMLISFLALVALINALARAGRSQPSADLRLGVCADRVEHGRAVARCADHRQSARHADGAQRVRRLFTARADEGNARSALVHDCDVRTLRICELQLDWHSDRRHRRARTDEASRSGAARLSRDARRHAGEFRDRDDRRVSVMSDQYALAHRAAEFLRGRVTEIPTVAIVLGSGLGGFTPSLSRTVSRSPTATSRIGPRPPSSVMPGKLVVGSIGGRRVAALSGRAHFYEGHPMSVVTFATRVMGLVGVRTLVLTNAAGGVNLNFKPGTLMVIDDHINLMGTNPLVGPQRRSLWCPVSRHDRGLLEASASGG